LSVNTSKSGEKASVKLPIIIVAAFALIIFLVVMGVRQFAPQHQGQTEQMKAEDVILAKIAKQAGPSADLTKVNADDLAKFNAKFQNPMISTQDILKRWMVTHPGPY